VTGLSSLVGRIGDRADRRRLVGVRLVIVPVDRDRRDEDVAADVGREQLGRRLDQSRHEPRRIDDRIPAAAGQRLEVTVAVAAERLHVRVEAGVRLAAIEQRDGVTARECGVDDMRTEEPDATEYEDRLLRGRGWGRTG